MTLPKYYEDGFALLMGINYNHWRHPLNGPLKDIEAIQKHFLDLSKACYNPDNVIVLDEEKATTSSILTALDDLAVKCAANPQASVTIYYTGHGGTKDGKYFLIPYDFNITDWQHGILDESRIVQTKQFADKINKIKAKKCMVILDCCHAEGMPVEKSLNQKIFLDGLVNNLESEIEDVRADKDIALGLKKGSGKVILTSCRANETSLDLGRISLFTKVLLDSLNGKMNIENDGWVRLIDLIRYVPKTVSTEALAFDGHSQNPMFKRIEDLSSEDFIICAYDIATAKNIKLNVTNDNSDRFEIDEYNRIIDEGLFPDLFNLLDAHNIENKPQYNRLKKEFAAGLKGIDLIDFGDRMKVFISHLKN